MKYQSGAAFRHALEDRLRARSFETGVPLVRLRKMVAFDRFLSRLIQHQPGEWILKGGFALQLRLGERARTTKDLDMLALAHQRDIHSPLRNAGALDLGDWFHFEVEESNERKPDEFGGVRFHIHAFLDSRTFEEFHIDVGMGDPIVEPIDHLKTPALLDFAGIQPTIIPCYPIAQQITEKLHAYTRLHPSGESTRVKDLVDILLLAELGKIDRISCFMRCVPLLMLDKLIQFQKDCLILLKSGQSPIGDWLTSFLYATLLLMKRIRLLNDF